MVRLDNVTKEYQMKNAVVKALDGVNLCFDRAELVLVTGENGCGKSTLLNIIGGLDKPSSGKVSVEGAGDRLKDKAERISYIFQTSNLIGMLTVKQNLEIVADDKTKIDSVIEKCGLTELSQRYPHELSIGQQQRVSIARAIVKDDGILLADEPTSSLDPDMREEIAALLTDIAKDRLVVVVTHYPEDFKQTDRHIVMKSGRIVSDERISDGRPAAENGREGKHKRNLLSVFQSSFARTRRHVLRFAVNFFMLLVGLICIVINECVFSYHNDDNNVYRQVLASDEILVVSDDYSALEGEVKPIYRSYGWSDFPDYFASKNTQDMNSVKSDYFKAFYFYSPYFMDIDDIGDRKLVAGRMPEASDEIVINKYLADLYIRYYAKEKLNSYSDVVEKAVLSGADYGLSVQENPVFRIVGITDDDLSVFEDLKNSNTSFNDLMNDSSRAYENLDGNIVLFYELCEWLEVGGGAVYAVDSGAEENSVNGYYNGETDWTVQKKNIQAKSGSGIVNLDYESADWLDVVEIYGNTQGAVVNFDSVSDTTYKELCEKYDDEETIRREIDYVLEKYSGTQLYFSMEYIRMEKYDSIIDGIFDPFSKTYYFDFTLQITGIYVPDDSYFGKGGVFAQYENGKVSSSVILLNGTNYDRLNTLYNTPPDCGLALLDVSGMDTSADVKEKIAGNKNITEFSYIGEFMLEANKNRINIVNVTSLIVGVIMLVFSLIFVLYSLSQYFKQHSVELGILMSLGKGKGYCSLFVLGEYLFMFALSAVIAIPVLFIVPAILNAAVSGVASKLEVFLSSGMAYAFVIAYLVLLAALSFVGVVAGVSRKTPIERIREDR